MGHVSQLENNKLKTQPTRIVTCLSYAGYKLIVLLLTLCLSLWVSPAPPSRSPAALSVPQLWDSCSRKRDSWTPLGPKKPGQSPRNLDEHNIHNFVLSRFYVLKGSPDDGGRNDNETSVVKLTFTCLAFSRKSHRSRT